MTTKTYLNLITSQTAQEMPAISRATAVTQAHQASKAAAVNLSSAPTNTVPIAGNECLPVGTAVKNIVQTPAETLPTNSANGSGKQQGDVSHCVTSPPSDNGQKRPYRFPIVDTAVCEYCGAEMTVKRNTGPKRKRYCSGACRVAAHRQRREAGRGRADFALFMLTLIVAVAVLWFFWPLLQQIAAMRPTLAPTPTAVPVYPVTWPESPQPAPTAVPQALPQAAPETAVSPAPAVVTNDVKPAPTFTPDWDNIVAATLPPIATATATATAVPAWWNEPAKEPADTAVTDQGQPGAADLLHITIGARVYEVTPTQLVDCINAQQNGLRTGPKCPPNAAAFAGLLGQGR